MSLPNISCAKSNKTCFKSVNETFLSIYSPSTWWKKQCARAEIASLRYTRPGQITRMGGCWLSMTRACTEDVCERSTMSGRASTKKVSCMSRAGWSSAKFIDEYTCQSSSISGPSASVKPRREKISTISFFTMVSGWRVPNETG